MRFTTGLILLAALAACGRSAPPANNAANAAASAPSALSPAPAPAPTAPAPAPAAGLAEFRQDSLRGCLVGAREAAPPGAPIEQHCTCAVDRVMAGRSFAELEAEQRSGEYEGRFQAELTTCIGR